MSRDERPATVPELERRLSELGNLYEVARSLLGARDGAHVASRIVLAAMGTFGARSGALYVAGERDRLRLAFAYGEGITTGDAGLRLDDAARAALEGRGAMRFGGTTPRALAPLREKLEARHGAEAVAAVEGPDGPAGLLVLGPRLIDDPYDDGDLDTLEAIAGLARLALGARGHAVAARAAAPARSAARRLAALRGAHPALRAIVGESETLAETFEDLVAVAASRVPVLIAGESGVGKELAARAIHEMSDRADGPFEVVDCGSIPRELIESELFGHVRGSFTGAHRDRRGAFEVAHRGTLFLDEIGEMPLQLQTRLLRVLQEGRFRRVGDERPIDTDVRVLAASNRDLRAEVEGGRFRQDLFFRLNVYPIRLPPLRERLEDLPALVAHFLPAGRGAAPTLEPGALEALRRHTWPGNIRELGNFCAALAVRARGGEAIGLDTVERAWRRQYPGDPPWHGEAPAATPRGRLGGWAIEQARAARFNLVEAARALQRRKRRGESIPVTERSALSYYVTGEILRALAANRGDLSKVAAAIAGDEDLVPRVRSRIDKVVEALHACDDERAARRKFAKLPGGYEAHVVAAFRAVTR